ncbi:MAG: hypothetical protein EZS28_044994 [Streblomastix strix]|uniref:Uncharacterized protein n=1 Tax=Streblomastix strix TaxID=222440 RepID=A0A5J4TNB2_9EUKA|nr:MAG: hypothetical protein EZS28_044994 [Streblomastix strix]
MTMYFMKHGKQTKVKSDSGDEIIQIVGDPDQEPSCPRIFSLNDQIIKTDFTSTRLKALNVGIRDQNDLYDIPNEGKTLDQRLQEDFAEFVGYFSAVLQMDQIPKRINNEYRFSLFVYSNEPIHFAERIAVNLPQQRQIIARWPSKPMLNYSLMEKDVIQVKNQQKDKIVKSSFLRRKSNLVNVSVPTVSQSYLQQYFIDYQGIKDQGLFEVFQ